MDTDHLKTFVVTARTQNFHVAARRLFLGEATIAQRVKRLEEELGTTLFDRIGRNVHLNAAGNAFLPRAERILQEEAAAQSAIATLARGAKGHLRLAASPYIARSFLPAVLVAFEAAHPDVEWALDVVPTGEIAQMIEEGRADLGIVRVRPEASPLPFETYWEEPLTLVALHDGMDMDREVPFAGAVLESSALLTYGPEVSWERLLSALRLRGTVPPRVVAVSQVATAKAFVARGLGVSFLPASSVQRELALGVLMAVPTPGLPVPGDGVYGLWGAREREEVRAFREAARQVLAAGPLTPSVRRRGDTL